MGICPRLPDPGGVGDSHPAAMPAMRIKTILSAAAHDAPPATIRPSGTSTK